MTTIDPAHLAQVRSLARLRWRFALSLTLIMVAVYFGFILMVAYQPDVLAQLVSEGLTLGILLGALVIVAAWLLTLVYVAWANRSYDPRLARLRANTRVMQPTTRFGEPDAIAIGFFAAFIVLTLAITWWAARRTRTTEHFYAAGRTVTAGQNGFALR